MTDLPDLPVLALLAGIVFVAYTVQALSGFAANVVALTLGALVLDAAALVPVIVALSTAFSAYIVVRDHAEIDRALLLRRVLPLSGVGTVAGALVAPLIAGPNLQRAFGGLVVLLSAHGLWRLLGRTGPVTPRGGPFTHGLMLGAGLVHGIFATGGPLLVLAVDRAGLAKRAFRSTLSVVWVVLGVVLLALFVPSGRLGLGELQCIGALTPPFLLGVWLGDWGHRHVDERRFRVVVYCALVVAGAIVAR